MLAEYGQSNSVREERMTNSIKFTTAAKVASGLGDDGFSLIKNQRYDNTYYRAEARGEFTAWGFDHDLTAGYSNSERKQKESYELLINDLKKRILANK